VPGVAYHEVLSTVFSDLKPDDFLYIFRPYHQRCHGTQVPLLIHLRLFQFLPCHSEQHSTSPPPSRSETTPPSPLFPFYRIQGDIQDKCVSNIRADQCETVADLVVWNGGSDNLQGSASIARVCRGHSPKAVGGVSRVSRINRLQGVRNPLCGGWVGMLTLMLAQLSI